jgi:hypothetical protein
MGTREGAAESPHLFNMYIGELRRRLEEQRPRLCMLAHIAVAVLLYADDAAIPADSAEDLAIAASIVEGFCNDMHLFISTGKSFITVFHSEQDDGVTYYDEACWVDGQQIIVSIYDEVIKACASFKYLGVTLDEHGSPKAHLDNRLGAVQRAGNALISGLRRVPSYSHSFLQYLWSSLVVPVGCYGVELFEWRDTDMKSHVKAQTALWRRLLKLSGRSPTMCSVVLMGVGCNTLEWRVRRVAHLLRLANSPPDSLHHAALVYFISVAHPWYIATLQDLQLVYPNVRLLIGHESGVPSIYSTGEWDERRSWHSAQPYELRCDALGRKRRFSDSHQIAEWENRAIRNHVRSTSRQLRSLLAQAAQKSLLQSIAEANQKDQHTKTALLEHSFSASAPSLSLALDWAGPASHVAALAALFSGDFFLARYAGNFFAKSLIPSSKRIKAILAERGIQPSRICMTCWWQHSQLHLEDEAHLIFHCPLYAGQRRDLFLEFSAQHSARIQSESKDSDKLSSIFSSMAPTDWAALARFLARARQLRRKMKLQMHKQTLLRESCCFTEQRSRWRAHGKFVCRHGVFFDSISKVACPCLEVKSNAIWIDAVKMPAMDFDLKCLIAVPFDECNFQRLSILQAECRKFNWM